MLTEKCKIDDKKSNAKSVIMLHFLKEDFSFIIILLYYYIYIGRSFLKKHMEKNKKISPCIHKKSKIKHNPNNEGMVFFTPIDDGESFLIFSLCFFHIRFCIFLSELCFFFWNSAFFFMDFVFYGEGLC